MGDGRRGREGYLSKSVPGTSFSIFHHRGTVAQRGSLFSRNGRHFAEKVRRFFFARSFRRIPLRRRERGGGGVGREGGGQQRGGL